MTRFLLMYRHSEELILQGRIANPRNGIIPLNGKEVSPDSIHVEGADAYNVQTIAGITTIV